MQRFSLLSGMYAAPSERGAELITDFLWSTAELTPEETARIAGVSVATLNRWRRGGTRKIRKDIRNRLLAHLEQQEARGARSRAA